MLIIFGFLCGTVLAFRFAVYILLPAILIGWLLAIVAGLVAASSVSAIVLEMVAIGVALQLGYLGGIALRWGLAAARMHRRGEWTVKSQAPSGRAF